MYLLKYKSEGLLLYSKHLILKWKISSLKVKGLRIDWWGKYSSGIFSYSYKMSMELFNIVTCHILHD
jgi:hypothetical protein